MGEQLKQNMIHELNKMINSEKFKIGEHSKTIKLLNEEIIRLTKEVDIRDKQIKAYHMTIQGIKIGGCYNEV